MFLIELDGKIEAFSLAFEPHYNLPFLSWTGRRCKKGSKFDSLE